MSAGRKFALFNEELGYLTGLFTHDDFGNINGIKYDRWSLLASDAWLIEEELAKRMARVFTKLFENDPHPRKYEAVKLDGMN